MQISILAQILAIVKNNVWEIVRNAKIYFQDFLSHVEIKTFFKLWKQTNLWLKKGSICKSFEGISVIHTRNGGSLETTETIEEVFCTQKHWSSFNFKTSPKHKRRDLLAEKSSLEKCLLKSNKYLNI